MSSVHDISEIMSREHVSATTALERALTRQRSDYRALCFPGSPSAYKIENTLSSRVDAPCNIFGHGAHAAVLEFKSTEHQLYIEETDPDLLHWNNSQFGVRDLQIRYAEGAHGGPFTSAIRVMGRGSEEGVSSKGVIENVQFGSPDRRPIWHPLHPGQRQTFPHSWISLSGAFSTAVKNCTFGAQLQGDITKAESYFPHAGIQFDSSAGNLTDISGTAHRARSMNTDILNCEFEGGRHGVYCTEDTWIEGLVISGARMRGVWRGVYTAATRPTAASGTFVRLINSHIAFNRCGATFETGAGIQVVGNDFIALSTGSFGSKDEMSHYVQLGAAGENRGVVGGRVLRNEFLQADLKNVPYVGVFVDGNSRRITVGPNFLQRVEWKAFHATETTSRIKFVEDA